MLKAAGYVDSPEPGIWRITQRGRDLLARYPDRFDEETGRQVIREGRSQIQGEDAAEDTSLGVTGATVQQTPDERIDAALKEVHRSVAQELLDKIAQAPPAFFEDLVLDLLHALGYGTTEDDLERVGHAGDGGIDGVISLDKLGFERVYIQAKRWGKVLSVDRKCRRFTERLRGGVRERVSSLPPQASHGRPEISQLK